MGLFSSNPEPESDKPQVDGKLKEFVDGKFWKIRPCEIYKKELKECTRFKGRFYQYFVDGELKDCNEWQRDLVDCKKWTDSNDYKAAESLILSEEARIKKRFVAHYKNNIWEHRDSPPEDWAKPLPEWMQKEQENSYLYHQSQALKKGETLPDTNVFSKCSIM